MPARADLVFLLLALASTAQAQLSEQTIEGTAFDRVRIWAPPAGSRGAYETILLLHGNQGPDDDPAWMVELHGERRFARTILVAPGSLRGDYQWDRPRTARALAALMTDVARRYPVDPDRTYLLGYSAGGSRVLGVAARGHFRGLISIAGDVGRPLRSGLTPTPLPMLLICNSLDDGPSASCPLDERNAAELERRGFHVDRERLIGSHALVFARVAPLIGRWLDGMRPR